MEFSVCRSENFANLKSKMLTPTLWLGRLALHIGMQSRPKSFEAWEKPWLGFAYGSWLPRLRVTRGPRYVPSISGYWLCFHASADLWPHHVGWGLM